MELIEVESKLNEVKDDTAAGCSRIQFRWCYHNNRLRRTLGTPNNSLCGERERQRAVEEDGSNRGEEERALALLG